MSWMDAFELATRTRDVSFGERGQSGFRWTDLVEMGRAASTWCFPLIEREKRGDEVSRVAPACCIVVV